ncbi:hypothetical protein Fmac_011630 [Flemingia macrophylla]|uniref:Uncharacterized protein n=1 Tax=Flemingia macrophylla TaxID=520843 RepID=A0ABD1MN04_9FABA
MGYLEKVITNMILLVVLLLSMNLATARQPLWMSEPHHQAYGRLLAKAADDPHGHNYHP